ncbi:Hypothetical protein CAP_0144 [Chondromyces apiculatus DSM 436]|uniref:Uncharacterized protein n=1 Tax=Chondromyces apiculatus DSM 436 TaxID=1192034 RepID=A0A017TFJ1_9BACT|nr:Hypothetical protein CAP_0144 [Chondromyces apiculatus DSM 436]
MPWLGAGGEQGAIYVLRRGDEVLWRVGIDFGEASHVPFREELVWESAGVVALGGGDAVYVLDLGTGAARARIAVPSLFGHLALVSVPAVGGGNAEVLLVLGWTDVHAIDGQLAPCWVARDVAVDGILLREARDQELHMLAEMDPPGGWVGIVLDARTGAELSREAEPVFDEEGPGAPVDR